MPGQPPFGASPLTQPTPNRGMQGAGFSLVSGALKQLEEALPKIGSDNPGGIALMKAIQDLRKHFQEGGASAGNEKSAQEKMMMQQRQEALIPSILRMAGQQQQQPPQTPPGAASGMPQL